MPKLEKMHIQGYRSLADFEMELGDLTVLIGPNASGKSTVADLLLFTAEAMNDSLLVPIGNRGGFRSLLWNAGALQIGVELHLVGLSRDKDASTSHTYSFEIEPVRADPVVTRERLLQSIHNVIGSVIEDRTTTILSREGTDIRTSAPTRAADTDVPRSHLALGSMMFPSFLNRNILPTRRLLTGVEVYSPFDVGPRAPLRKPYDPSSKTAPDTHLRPGGDNLVGVISLLKGDLSYADHFAQLEEWLAQAFEGFDGLGISPAVAGAEQALLWREYGRRPLHAGQLSDGILHFLCLATLCASPEPPTLVAIDEPEIGLHPGLLPLVAAMLETLSERTQVIVVTHSPQLLSGFSDIECIRVISKDENGAHAHRPADSKALRKMLEPTVGATLGSLFESGDLEVPPEPQEARQGEADL